MAGLVRRTGDEWILTLRHRRTAEAWQRRNSFRRISNAWVSLDGSEDTPQILAYNLAINPRAVSGGGRLWGADFSWGAATQTFITGMPGWDHGTTTAASTTFPSANSSSGNCVTYVAQDETILEDVPVGSTLPVTVQASRSLGTNLMLAFVWLNSNGNWIGEITSPELTVTPGEVATLTINATRPENVYRFFVQVRARAARQGEVLAVTNLCVGSETFFDGNTPDTDGIFYSWTDTPNASVSVASTSEMPPFPLFSADVGVHGLSRYANIINPQGISVVDDPILGPQRKALQLTTLNTYQHPTTDPRTQVEAPGNHVAGHEVFVGYSVLFPSDYPSGYDLPEGHIAIGSMYGPPYAGKGPLGINVSRVGNLRWERNVTYGYDVPWEHSLTRNMWYDFVHRFKLSEDPGIGYVELYLNTGDGWEQQTLNGQSRLYMKTLDHTNYIGPNRHALTNYWTVDMFESVTIYFADHKVGSSFAEVEPSSYL